VPFPFVAVTLPDDTPPAYVASLLSACSQAYPEGSCQTGPDSSPATATTGEQTPPGPDSSNGDSTPTDARQSKSQPGERADDSVILANINWTNPNTATVNLGLPHWRNHRWIERSLPFKEHDQPLERYRALGFTIGSLAVTVSEVAKLEQEAREPEPKVDAPPETTAAVGAQPEPATTTTPATVVDPPDALDIPVITDDGPSQLSLRGYLAGELGEGFDTVRRGGSVGVGLFGENWGGHVNGYYSDASGNGLNATFAGVEVTADLRIEWPMLEANICVGGGYGHLSARVDKEASQVYPSGLIAVNVMPARWRLAPYLGLGVRLFRGFETDVPGLDSLGPVTPFIQLGVVLSSHDDTASD
jgi:hypothetical protein